MGDKLVADTEDVPSALAQLPREQIWARSTDGVGICTELLSRRTILMNLFVKDGDGLTGAPT